MKLANYRENKLSWNSVAGIVNKVVVIFCFINSYYCIQRDFFRPSGMYEYFIHSFDLSYARQSYLKAVRHWLFLSSCRGTWYYMYRNQISSQSIKKIALKLIYRARRQVVYACYAVIIFASCFAAMVFCFYSYM